MEISEKLRYYRKQKNLTQQNLADKLHLSRKTISAWENGRSYPDIKNATQLSDIFGISTDDFLRDNVLSTCRAEQVKQNPRAIIITKFSYVLNIFLVLMFYAHIFKLIHIHHSIFSILLLVNLLLFFINYTDWTKLIRHKKLIPMVLEFVLLVICNSIIIPLYSNFFSLLKIGPLSEKLGLINSVFCIIIVLSVSIILVTFFCPFSNRFKRKTDN